MDIMLKTPFIFNNKHQKTAMVFHRLHLGADTRTGVPGVHALPPKSIKKNFNRKFNPIWFAVFCTHII